MLNESLPYESRPGFSGFAWRCVALALVLLTIGVCAGCGGPSPVEVARNGAEEFFSRYSSSTADEAEWGMRSCHVFGRMGDGELGVLNWFWAGIPSIALLPNETSVYRVEIPFWCKGTKSDGTPTKVSRRLAIEVDARTGAVRNHAFMPDERLSFARQVVGWLASAMIAPFLVYASMLMGQGWRAVLRANPGWFLFGSTVVSLAASGLVGLACFGALFPAVVCALVYGVLWFGILARWFAWLVLLLD